MPQTFPALKERGGLRAIQLTEESAVLLGLTEAGSGNVDTKYIVAPQRLEPPGAARLAH